MSLLLSFDEATQLQDVYGLRPQRTDEALQRSLSLAYASLASVLLALRTTATPATAPSHIPWRDSPLTKWLRAPLAASATVAIVAAVAPGVDAAAETLATLTYVTRFRSPCAGAGVVVKPSWGTPASTPRGDTGRTLPARVAVALASPASSPRRAAPQPPRRGVSAGGAGSPRSPPAGAVLPVRQLDAQLRGRRRAAAAARLARSASCCSPRARDRSPRRRGSGGGGAAAAEAAAGNRSAADHEAYEEVLEAVRRAGGSLREEALLEQLVEDLSSLRAQVAVADHRAAATADEVASLQGIIETQAADRAASISVIDELQEELRTAHTGHGELENRIALLQSELDIARAPPRGDEVAPEAPDMAADAAAAREEAAALRGERDDLAARLAASEVREARVRADVDGAAAAAAASEARAVAADQRAAAAHREREELRTQEQRATADADALRSRLAALDGRIGDTESRLKDAMALETRVQAVRPPISGLDRQRQRRLPLARRR